MRNGSVSRLGWSLLVVGGLLAPAASAQRGRPGSLLLFPEFDSRSGALDLVTVTNTATAAGAGVQARWRYVDGSNCFVIDVVESLAPRDTLTVFTGVHAPFLEAGYLVVVAEDAAGAAIVHNHLVGTATRLDAFGQQGYTVEPFAFRAPGLPGAPTDHDGDGSRDLDGLEYTRAGDRYEFARFLGQGDYRSELVLVDLTGGSGFSTTIDLLVWNDNSEVFSLEYTFDCWAKVPLQNVSPLFSNSFLANNTNHALDEVVGAPQVETGWMQLDGVVTSSAQTALPDPAFVAFLVESTVSNGREASSPAFRVGEQSNGSLIPNGLGGNR